MTTTQLIIFTEYQKRVLSLLIELRNNSRSLGIQAGRSTQITQVSSMGEFEELEESLMNAQERQSKVRTFIRKTHNVLESLDKFSTTLSFYF